MRLIHLKNVAFALVTFFFASLASAQYVWLNENGTKQFSDTPPPSSVPKNRILKEPGPSSKPDTQATPETGKGPNLEGSGAPMTWAERNADFQKRKAEQAKKDAKAADEEKLAANKAKNCENARNQQKALSISQAIYRLDENGQRIIVTGEQRAKELQEAKSILEKCN